MGKRSLIGREQEERAWICLARLHQELHGRVEWQAIHLAMESANQALVWLQQWLQICINPELMPGGATYRDIEALDRAVRNGERVLELLGQLEARGCDPDRVRQALAEVRALDVDRMGQTLQLLEGMLRSE